MESEFLNKSLLLNLFSFINIDNLPFSFSTAIILCDSNFVTFNILSSSKSLSVCPVDEEISWNVLEELPPIGVGAPDLHVFSFSGALDVE